MDPEHVDSSDNNSVTALSESKSERSTVAHDSPELEENTTSRKRPRLDSGAEAVRALSTEPLAKSTSSTSPTDSKMDDSTAMSKLSINTKVTNDIADDPAAGAPTQNGVHSEASSATTASTTDEVVIEDANIDSPEKAVSPCASSGSPVRIEAAEPEDIDGRPSSPEIQIVETHNENASLSSVLNSFPFNNSTAVDAARMILKVTKEQDIPFNYSDPVFENLGLWIRNLLHVLESHPAGAVYFLHDNTTLWKEIGKIIDTLLDKTLSAGNMNEFKSEMEELLPSYSSFTRYLVESDLATTKAHFPTVSPESSPPVLSNYHMKVLAKSFEDTPLFGSLREFLMDTDGLKAIMVQSFCQNGGLRNLFEFGICLLESVHLDRSLEPPLLSAVHLVVAAMPIIGPMVSQAFFGWTPQALAQAFFDLFKAADARLLGSLEKHGKVLLVEERKALVTDFSKILPAIQMLDDTFSKQLGALIVKDGTPVDVEILEALWKVKICTTYLAKANMDLRVNGTVMLGNALADLYNTHRYRRFGQLYDSMGHAIAPFRRVAREMADRGILETIFGVDCHDQIVDQCLSICQFMSLARDYSHAVVDAIWTPFAKGQNSRAAGVVMRTLSSLVGLDESFFTTADRIYLCRQICASPPRSLSKEFLAMLDNLYKRIVDPAFPASSELLTEGLRVSVKLTQFAWKMPKEDRFQICSLLSSLASRSDQECRKTIYIECLTTIREDRQNADATVDCILAITEKEPPQRDFEMLVGNLDLVSTLVYDLQAFNNECHNFGDCLESEKALKAYEVRVFLLLRLVACHAAAIVDENFIKVWTCLVGENALGHKGRDIFWSSLGKHATWKSSRFHPAVVESAFLDLCLVEGLPSVRPEHFTCGLLGFLRQAITYVDGKNRRLPSTEGEAMMANLVELLWRIVSEAEEETVSDIASESLVSFYLDGQHPSENATAQKHQDLAARCLSQLEASYVSQTSAGIRTFGRILGLIGKFIYYHPQGQRIGSALKSAQHLAPLAPQVGRHIRVVYWLGPKVSCEVNVGKLETLVEFEAQLHQLTGMDYLQVLYYGTPIDLLERPMQTLGGFVGTSQEPLSITINSVQPSYVDWYLKRAAMDPPPTGVMESAIMSQFDVLYGFMAKTDDFGRSTYWFLNLFAPHDGAFLEDLHSADSMFQCMYAIRFLRFKLKDEALNNDTSAELLNRGITILSNYLIGIADLKQILDSPDGVELLSLAVSTLGEYIGASKISEEPHDVDAKKVMAQVLSLLKIAMVALGQNQLALKCYGLTLKLIVYSKCAWEELQSLTDITQLHHELFLEVQAANLARDVADTIVVTIRRLPEVPHIIHEDLIAWYFEVLAKLIRPASLIPERSEPLLRVLHDVFELRYPPKDTSPSSHDDLFEHVQAWATLIQEHEPVKCVNKEDTDPFIHGLGLLLRECLSTLSSLTADLPVGSLHIDIVNRLLFPETLSKDGKRSLPIVNVGTREVLYDLLDSASKDDTRLTQLTSAINQIVHLNTIGFVPEEVNDLGRSTAGYVGLANLANTCFMNSLLTQLFMNVPFRKFMLQVPVNPTAPSQRLLREIQKLFGFLQNSRARSFRPEELVSCMTTIDGSAIDPKLQMDVEEFLNCTFDQWEAQMPSVETRDTFRSFYHGKLLTQTKSKECEHISQKEEPYSVIQCNVKGLANLSQSLELFVQGEEMEGANKYKCESCDGRLVDAVRRTCLDDVQDSIIFHLMRFTFDMLTMERTKLNDYFEFPLTIDMGPYKKESIMNPESPHTPDIFNLVGVLLHSGQAESGHYISYIRERPSAAREPGKWIEFDDDVVSNYDMAGMSERFFGGTWIDHLNSVRPKTYSAYMLFYQRATTMDCGALDLPTNLEAPVPNWIAEEIESQNNEVMRDIGLLQDLHQEFVVRLLRDLKDAHDPEESHDRRMAIIQLSCQHLWQVLSKKYFDHGAIATIATLAEAVDDCVTCNHFAIRNLTAELNDGRLNVLYVLTVLTKHAQLRSSAREFIMGALRRIRDTPQLYGLDVQKDVDPANDCTGGGLGMMLKAVDEILMYGLEDITRWDDFFGIICDITRLGQHESAILICLRVLGRLLEMMTLPFRKALKTTAPRLDQLRKAINREGCELNNLIQALYLLLRHVDLGAQFPRPQAQPLTTWADGKLPLNQVEMEHFMGLKQNRVCWLETCLSRFDPSQEKPYPKVQSFDASAFIPLFVQYEPTLDRGSNVVNTIVEGVWADLNAVPLGNFMRAGEELCIAAQHQELFDEIVASMTKMDRENAEYYLSFYKSLLQRGSVPFRQYVLQRCDDWALPLMGINSPLPVRKDMAKLVIENLVDDSTTQHDTNIIRAWRMEVARSFLYAGRKMIRANGWMLKTITTAPLFEALATVIQYVQMTHITHPGLKKAEDVDLIQDLEGTVNSDLAPTAPTGEPVVVGKLGNHILTRDDATTTATPLLWRTAPDTPPLAQAKVAEVIELSDEEDVGMDGYDSETLSTLSDPEEMMIDQILLTEEERIANILLEFHHQQATAIDDGEPTQSCESDEDTDYYDDEP